MKTFALILTLLVTQSLLAITSSDLGKIVSLKLCPGGTDGEIFNYNNYKLGNNLMILKCEEAGSLFVLQRTDIEGAKSFKVREEISLQNPISKFYTNKFAELEIGGTDINFYFSSTSKCKTKLMFLTAYGDRTYDHDENEIFVVNYSAPVDTGLCVDKDTKLTWDNPGTPVAVTKNNQHATIVFQIGDEFIVIQLARLNDDNDSIKLESANLIPSPKPANFCDQLKEVRVLDGSKGLLTFHSEGAINHTDLTTGEITPLVQVPKLTGDMACPGLLTRSFDNQTDTILIDEKARLVQQVQIAYDKKTHQRSFKVIKGNY